MFSTTVFRQQSALVALAIGMLLGACGAPAAPATTGGTTPSPAQTAAAAPTQAATESPQAAPQAMTPTVGTEAPLDQAALLPALSQAIDDFYRANDSTLAGNVTVEVEAQQGNDVRVRVTPNQADLTDPAIGFLRQQDGAWTVLGLGTAFGPDFYQEFGIPESLSIAVPESPEVGEALAFAPPSGETCAAMQGTVSTALGHEATISDTLFTDVVSGQSGVGCQITVTGTGATLPHFLDVMTTLRTALTGLGWEEDQAYLADGPTGTATAFRKDGALALVSAGWSPAPDANCPPDQPISACELQPEQQLYTITLNLAQASTGGE